MERISQAMVDSGKLVGCEKCDIATWLPWRLINGKWVYEYFTEISRQTEDVGWSTCPDNLGLDRHHNQPWGDNQD